MLGDTGQVAWVVEVDGGDALEIGPAEGLASRRCAAPDRGGQIGWAGEIAAAPDGSVIAVAARDGKLLLVDVESGDVSELAESGDGAISDLAFAPDSPGSPGPSPSPATLRRLRLAQAV